MTHKYLDVVLTPAVLEAQEHYYGRSRRPTGAPERRIDTHDSMRGCAAAHVRRIRKKAMISSTACRVG